MINEWLLIKGGFMLNIIKMLNSDNKNFMMIFLIIVLSHEMQHLVVAKIEKVYKKINKIIFRGKLAIGSYKYCGKFTPLLYLCLI